MGYDEVSSLGWCKSCVLSINKVVDEMYLWDGGARNPECHWDIKPEDISWDGLGLWECVGYGGSLGRSVESWHRN